jgi:hypothetical protein
VLIFDGSPLIIGRIRRRAVREPRLPHAAILPEMKDRNKLNRKIPKKRQPEVSHSGARVASSKRLQTMKRASQSRDRKLVAKGGAVDEMFLIHPDLANDARIVWPAED